MDEARIFTKLFDSSNEEIAFSRLSSILRTYFAFLLPFLCFKSILGLDDAVKAVSEPDKKPEMTISKVKNINSIIVNKDINRFYLINFFILFKLILFFKKALPMLLSNTKFILPSIFFLSL